ncbi:MAG: BamA/TamA family outer membrane protein, partial [Parvularculaceae bacterium]
GIRTSIFSDFGIVGLVDESNKLLNADTRFFVNPVTGNYCVSDILSNPTSPGLANCIAPIQDDLGLRVSAGVSVSWDSPFGPVRFDFAKVLRKEEYDRTQGFRFSAGTSF